MFNGFKLIVPPLSPGGLVTTKALQHLDNKISCGPKLQLQKYCTNVGTATETAFVEYYVQILLFLTITVHQV